MCFKKFGILSFNEGHEAFLIEDAGVAYCAGVFVSPALVARYLAAALRAPIDGYLRPDPGLEFTDRDRKLVLRDFYEHRLFGRIIALAVLHFSERAVGVDRFPAFTAAVIPFLALDEKLVRPGAGRNSHAATGV